MFRAIFGGMLLIGAIGALFWGFIFAMIINPAIIGYTLCGACALGFIKTKWAPLLIGAIIFGVISFA